MWKLAICLLPWSVAVAGCAMDDFVVAADHDFFTDHHPGFVRAGNPWIGRSSDELIDELGPPDIVLGVAPIGADSDYASQRMAFVYHMDRGGSSGCIDAYVVVEATGTISDYYCR
ncbi:MAG: hypothetical protein OEY08_19740 [Gammaproteobacteria bacterium]|nr:hypothetical protein [Gammaproteobacteria bacterium]